MADKQNDLKLIRMNIFIVNAGYNSRSIDQATAMNPLMRCTAHRVAHIFSYIKILHSTVTQNRVTNCFL